MFSFIREKIIYMKNSHEYKFIYPYDIFVIKTNDMKMLHLHQRNLFEVKNK